MAKYLNEWSNTPGSNNFTQPDGWPEGITSDKINNIGREQMAVLSRWEKDNNGSVLTTGTQPAYVITLNQTSIAAYYDGLRMCVDFHATNASATPPTANVNAIGAKALVWPDGTALTQNEITLGMKADLVYDGTNLQVLSLKGPFNVVEDTTPQLGGDLDLNGNNIDFPTTANISDVLDEDDMATDSATALATQQSIKAYVDGFMPQNYLTGCILSNNGTDAAHDLDISAGRCRDSTNAQSMTLAAITKQIDAAWAVGTAAGGLDGTESVAGTPDADTWYTVYVIKRNDTGVVDALFSENATSPTLPTNYDVFRRIGAVLTDGSANIIAFAQDGDNFLWDDPPLDLSDANGDTTGTTVTLSVPAGVRCMARVNIAAAGAQLAYLSSTDQNNEAASDSGAPLGSTQSGTGDTGVGYAQVLTDTSGNIRYRTQSTGAIRVSTLGWADTRGK